MHKRWKLRERSEKAITDLSPTLHPVAERLFAQRGIATAEEAFAFLHPTWDSGIHDPFLFSQMRAAVERVFRALETGERITVHGDYDADGVTGSAVLISTLREIERKVRPSSDVLRPSSVDSYIPHRDREGYGLHSATVEELKERGTSLIITVDCGIACVDEIAKAKTLGMDTIVVDHHQYGETLPDGILIHPRLPGETYPFPHLAAVGVSWKLATALILEAQSRGLPIPPGSEKWLLDLVAIATVTDMVPLVGENRVLETFGLVVLNKTRRPGMIALCEEAGCVPGTLTTESVGFALGPRLNAAGRMDHASHALELMLAETIEDARVLAAKIESLNRDRQSATRKMMEEADGRVTVETEKVIVLWSEQWSPSLVGLLAGKYLDKTGRPTVAIGKHGDRWVGSGRSFSAYDITAAMKRAGEGMLTHVGGHVQACGFSFSHELAIETLIERLRQDGAERLENEDCAPVMLIDAEMSLEELQWTLIETLSKFEPYGEGNPKPLFMTRGLTVVSCDLVGNTSSHVRCTLRSPTGSTQKFIGFKFGPRIGEFSIGARVDVVYDVGVNEWNGRKDIQCKLVDVRTAQEI